MALARARVAVDVMGGDYAPDEILAGAVQAQAELDADVILVGDPETIAASLEKQGLTTDAQIVASEGVIDMHDEAMSGLKRKPKASVSVAMSLVKQGEADAVFSAGHSGASMAAALLRIGRLPGIERPAIGAIMPSAVPGHPLLMLDVGAIVDCRPRYLEQFARIGTIYSQYALGVQSPRVGLLSIGEESSKGNDLTLKTHQLLKDNPQIPFAGNVEGRDVLSGNFDVVVCDGFVGNILLKFAEAVGDVMLQLCQEEILADLDDATKATLAPRFKRFKQRVDYVEHGGALLLGIDGICVIGHGSSKAPTIYNGIRLAKDAVERGVIDRLREAELATPSL
ncbi:MAG: phosphate acyltransferase PlsX [Oscillatoriales cyanobacterium]|nr:MAG: phosphate acyltransferase PlsX [Oscillatoriales cyanobacterium]